MQQVDTDDRTITENPILNIGVPENKIDVKVILMALQEEIIEIGIRVSNREFPKGTNVVIPSIRGTFDIWFDGTYIYFKRFTSKKTYKIPCLLNDSKIPEEIIDVLCALVDHHKLNEFKI